jgi:hypothetical protein
MRLDVNTDASIKLTAKLEKLHRSAFPSAVRNTLNEVAFEHKTLIPKVAKHKFKYERNTTFFRAITNVEKAQGFDVNKMKSVSGLNSKALGGKANKVIQNLEKQESGGTINGRKLLINSSSRVGSNISGRVQSSARFEKNELHDSSDAFKYQLKKTGSRKSAYISAVASSIKAGSSSFIIKAGRKGKLSGMAYRIASAKSNLKSGKTTIKTKKTYGYISDNTFIAKKNNFVSDARRLVIKKIDKIYQQKAEFQFKKHLK